MARKRSLVISFILFNNVLKWKIKRSSVDTSFYFCLNLKLSIADTGKRNNFISTDTYKNLMMNDEWWMMN